MSNVRGTDGKKSRAFYLLFAAGLSAAMLASCGQQAQQTSSDSQNEDDQPETVIVYRDSTEQQDDSAGSGDSTTSTSSTDSTNSASSSTELPEGYPIPLADDHEVQNVRVGGDEPDDEGDIDVDLQVPDGQAAYDYYTQTLESEGFTIEETDIDNDSTEFDADIDFRNDEYDGSVDFSGNNVEIDLDQQNNSGAASSSSGGSSDDVSDDASNDTSGGSASSDAVPADFPLPGDYEIQNVRVGGDDSDDQGDVSLDLNVPDGQAAYDYYVQNLEGEGFRLEESEVESDSGQFEGDIDFDGDSYDGSIDVRGNTVEIDIDRTN